MSFFVYLQSNSANASGEMAEWSKAAVSKTVNPHPGILGFESPSLRSMQSSKCAALSAAFFVKQDRQKLVFCKVPASQKNGLVVLHSAALLPDKRGNGRLCGQIPHLLLSLMITGENIHRKKICKIIWFIKLTCLYLHRESEHALSREAGELSR